MSNDIAEEYFNRHLTSRAASRRIAGMEVDDEQPEQHQQDARTTASG